MNADKYNELRRKESQILCDLQNSANCIKEGLHKQAIMELEHGRRLLVELTAELHADDIQRPG